MIWVKAKYMYRCQYRSMINVFDWVVAAADPEV